MKFACVVCRGARTWDNVRQLEAESQATGCVYPAGALCADLSSSSMYLQRIMSLDLGLCLAAEERCRQHTRTAQLESSGAIPPGASCLRIYAQQQSFCSLVAF